MEANKMIIFSGPVPSTCEDGNFNIELAESYEFEFALPGRIEIGLKVLATGRATHFRIIDDEDNCLCQGIVSDVFQNPDGDMILTDINLVKDNTVVGTLITRRI